MAAVTQHEEQYYLATRDNFIVRLDSEGATRIPVPVEFDHSVVVYDSALLLDTRLLIVANRKRWIIGCLGK